MLGSFAVSLIFAGGSLRDLGKLIDNSPSQAEQVLKSLYKPEELRAGGAPKTDGLDALFAVDAGPGNHRVMVEGDNLRRLELKPCGGLYARVQHLQHGFGSTVTYSIDGKTLPKTQNLEVYNVNRFVQPPKGGRKGEMRDMGLWEGHIYPGTTRRWYLYLPPGFDTDRVYPVLIGTDAQWDKEWQANALENCMVEGMIPPTIGIFSEAGQLKPGDGYKHRRAEYDVMSDAYSRFLLEEILPQASKVVKISHDPSQRCLVGVSSGAIAGFTCCWQRPDQFGNVISTVGSYVDLEGGHNYPFMIRKAKKKPIRVFLQDGRHDLDLEFGNWFLCNSQMASALKFKGYDFEWHSGQGFHSSDHMRSMFDKALVWWNGLKRGNVSTASREGG